ncbi:hypothetical protein OC834_007123, partial [Tilletia horrida]
YFGQPVNTPEQIYNSPLLHVDVLSLICGADRNETKKIRSDVQVAIRTGKGLKIRAQVRQPKTSLFGSATVLKSTVLHVCPLKDVENSFSATVVVFA